jgi:hypothetical protein
MRYKTHQEVLAALKPLNRVAYLRYMRALGDPKLQKWALPPDGTYSLSAAVFCSFAAATSVEGYKFWSELYNALFQYEKDHRDETIGIP